MTEARHRLSALIRELREEVGEVTLTVRGEPVATLTGIRARRPFDFDAIRRAMLETYGSEEAWARETRAFAQFMDRVVAARGDPSWPACLEDPADPDLP